MLTCQEVVARGSALLDGDLGFRERMAMRLHLAMCVLCRRFVRQLRLLVRGLNRHMQRAPVTEQFVDQVMRYVDEAGNR